MDLQLQPLHYRLWEKVDMPVECGDCPELIDITDPYNVGDSPSDYRCDTVPDLCPVVIRKLKELENANNHYPTKYP